MKINVGDIVGRISYGCDVYFKVTGLFTGVNGKQHACLKGLDVRLYANAPVEDLQKFEPSHVAAYWHSFMMKNHEQMKRVFQRREQDRIRSMSRANDTLNNMDSFDVPGSVLHVDGDGDYLDLCMTTYRQMNIPAYGYNIEEEKQPEQVAALLQEHRPDMLVLTGHDGLLKGTRDFSDINNYHNSRSFVEGVKVARQYEKSMDDLVIFAGACQSHYEAILKAGANFASSPQRVLIHAFDPVFVIEKIAYTSIYEPISIKDIIAGTITGFNGIGGVETRGKYRLGIPKSPY
ncbi:sporulation peptidase YabG [Desulfotomaculum copahuensis]|uniref:Sporulation peptidase YabG n=1 Tax=Desulfotomaculum copahuensis TaxID=1838280 RepID=A0A1B7LFN8_9FIRM|nr:sporulation peptidase YabG [Desulfotomaculum copahuensis]OAT82962.1 sporulation peptidase YabG [Desulfotomaculum copahuensis]